MTRRPARRGYPEPSFEGLRARAAPKDYHGLAAMLASAGASIEGGERPLLDFRRDLITGRGVAAVTITVHHAKLTATSRSTKKVPAGVCSMALAHRHPSSYTGDAFAAQTRAWTGFCFAP